MQQIDPVIEQSDHQKNPRFITWVFTYSAFAKALFNTYASSFIKSLSNDNTRA